MCRSEEPSELQFHDHGPFFGIRVVSGDYLLPTLQAEGHQVIAAQYGLDTLAGDVATVRHTLGRVSSPAILVGHSYGGSVITAAGTDDRVAGLGSCAALSASIEHILNTAAPTGTILVLQNPATPTHQRKPAREWTSAIPVEERDSENHPKV
jgi:pimeloyl-ACP methyl ester carboxylesterase